MAEAETLINTGEVLNLAILDAQLPDGDGVELCRRLRARFPTLPIVFYTAAAFASDQRRAEEAGCNVYLVKPYDSTELKMLVRRMLEGQSFPGNTAG